ncbi:LysM peptidoglycan-binding domain-containing protein [Ramlibacter monticola]|uniref:LysM peptidoglycan-binding domain-containing protein n=1 Tax=Ramlibacter monticola TaxID=1926872 RepID=A0A936Z2J0_9BURK|nr:LysM peptidoglycan-binding domain-containing protein [Ramlibacter monticola]MBL0393036.1 LysM peptidoglycan-binding domain-containing protein [Ramlibacter monticola]
MNLGSREVLGQAGLVGDPAQGRNGQNVYVNVSTGLLVLQAQDELLVARGPDAAVVRTYDSGGTFNDDNGDNWASGVVSLALAGTLNAAGSTVSRTDADGSTAVYTWNAARGLYLTTEGAGAHDTIAYLAAESQFEWRDGSTDATQRYEGSGARRLLASEDGSGNTLRYAYGANGFLSSVTTAKGEVTFYDYEGDQLAQVRTLFGATPTTVVRYEYDTSGRLDAVTVDLTPSDNSVADGKVYRTTYTYEGTSARLATITQTDGNSLAFTYIDLGGGSYKVASVRDGLGQTTSFTYDLGFATATDAQGLVTRYDFDTAGRLTRITAPAVAAGIPTRTFSYNGAGDVIAIRDGQSRLVSFGYDANGNQVLRRDAAGNTVTRTFDASNQLSTETVYFTPDPDAAGPLLPDAPATTRYVHDAAGRKLLRFTVTPQGRVTEYRYNGFGDRVASITYASGLYPTDGLAATAVPTEAEMAAWAGTQDLTATQRVDFAYDGRGQLQTRTAYARVAATGEGVADGSQSVESFVYSQSGLLLQSVSAAAGITSYTYDGLGRVLTSTNALGQVTVTQYDDAAGKTVVTLTNGLVTTSAYDAAGRLVAVTRSDAAAASLGETRYFYDAGNRLRMTEDATGVRSWAMYDAAGRKVADIDGNGRMTEYAFDRSDLLTHTVTYGTAVNTALLVDATGLPVAAATPGTVRPLANAADVHEWRSYDSAQRLLRTARTFGTAGMAAVTENRYDGASRLVEVVQFANGRAAASLVPGTIAAPVASDADRSIRYFHDSDGLLTGTLDAEGYLTVFHYTEAGLLDETIRYANATDPLLRATGTLAQLTPLGSADDLRSVNLYDGKGQLIAAVDGEGYLTENVFDANGKLTQAVRYANRATGTATVASTVSSLRPLPQAADSATLRVYDKLGRLTRETGPEGVVTQYAYDTAGNLVSTSRAVGTTEVRTLLARYDLQGRLTGELSALGQSLLTVGQTQAQIDAIWAQHGTSHSYDAAGRRISSTDPAGNTTLFFYNPEGALTHTVNALGEVKETRYDVLGRVVQEFAYAGRIDAAGLVGGLATAALASAVAAIATSSDLRATYSYATDGRLRSSFDGQDHTTTRTYNAFGEEIALSEQVASGVVLSTAYTVDRRGLRTKTTVDPANVQGVNTVTSTVYDAFGRATRTVDANGNVRQQTFDRLGRVVTTVDPLNARRSTSYDAFDRVLTQTDALGRVTSYAYDRTTRSMTVTTPEGISTTTVQTRHGQVQSIRDGKGQLTSYTYDRNGKLLATATPLTTTSSIYDALGREIETRDANGFKVATVYDAAGRVLTRRVDPTGLNLTTTYSYDGKGQAVVVTDPNGVATTTQFDNRGQVLRQTVDPTGLNLETVYSYDASGHVLTVTRPSGTVTEYAYDAQGRRVQERVDPAGLALTRSWAYDGNGNVTSSTDARGNVTRYAYDADDRLVYTVDPMGNARLEGYDAAGRVNKTVVYATPISTIALGAAPTVAEVAARVVASPAQDQVQHRVYDRDGRLAATLDGTGGVTKFVYDANGNVVSRTAYAARVAMDGWVAGTVPAPVADATRDETTRTVYDALDRAVFTVNGVGAVVAQSYDGNGNVLKRVAYAAPIATDTAPTSTDIALALEAVGDPARDVVQRNVYDAAGRLIWSANGLGAVTGRVYDRNGNVVREALYAATVAASAAPNTVAAAGVRITSMAYDSANRRVFTVDALRAVTEQVYDADGNVVQRVQYAKAIASVPPLGAGGTVDAIRSRILADPAADRVSRFGHDAAGRQVLEIDALGAVTETRYDAAGNTAAVTEYADPVDTSALADAPTLPALRALIVPDGTADRRTRKVYDEAGRLVYTLRDLGPSGTMVAASSVEYNQYNGAGMLTRTTRHAGLIDSRTAATLPGVAAAVALVANAALDQSDAYTYNAAGQRLTWTDALGGRETSAYDALGRRLKWTNPRNFTWTYTYDAAGHLLTETTPPVVGPPIVGVDAAGNRVVADGDEVPIVTTMAYDALGNLVRRTEATGRPEERSTRYEYDAVGRQVRVIHPPVGVYNPAGDAVTTNGAAGMALRVETPAQALETQTFYDAQGNAVASRDVGNAISQKVYDVLGNVVYEVDAMGYVTSYARNAFGEVTTLLRYAQRTTLAEPAVTQASQAVTRAQVSAAVNAAGVDHTKDRRFQTVYDRAGRVIQTLEPSVYVYDPSATELADQAGAEGRTTQNTYDAFGQLVQVQTRHNAKAGTWSTTTHYYDIGGRHTATIDALGYVTERAFDASGNLARQTEYATPLQVAWTPAGHGLPVSSADDRATTYSYDRLNRKTAESRLDVEFSTAANGTSVRGTLTTTYGYDALGNLIRVTSPDESSTYTYFDALGRIEAVAAPSRTSTVGGTTLIPLTTFHRDAHGNVLAKVEHANGAAVGITPTSYDVAIGNASNDRITTSVHDSFGRSIQLTDANGDSSFNSYDAYGHVAKRWQSVTGDGATRTYFEVNAYDKLGQLVQTLTPASTSVYTPLGGIGTVTQAQAGVVSDTLEYNAFGEVVRKGSQGEGQEYSDYDNAGRLWRTNSGDGVDRVYLYDAEGHRTAEIQSAGAGGSNLDARSNVDIGSFASAQAAAANPLTRRTDFRYDALGRLVAKVEPGRAEVQGGVSVWHQFVEANVVQSATPDENSMPTGPNTVSLSWNSLAGLGSGDVKVRLQYRSSWGTLRTYDSGVLIGGAPATLATLEWTDGVGPDLGVISVERISVYKKDVNGSWRLVIDQPPGEGVNEIRVAAPPDPSTSLTLQLRRVGETLWSTGALADFGSGFRFDASGLAPGSYEYQVTAKPLNEAARVVGAGTIAVTQPSLSSIRTPITYGPAGPGVLAWAPPGPSYNQVLRYRPSGSTGPWSELPVISRETGHDGVDTNGLAAGQYQFELLWNAETQDVPSAHATGTFTVVAAKPAVWLPETNLPNIPGVVVVPGALVGTVIGQEENGLPMYATATIPATLQWMAIDATVARYRQPGGAWALFPIDNSSMTREEWGTPAGVQRVSLGPLGPNIYEVEIFVGSPPTAQATASVTVRSVTSATVTVTTPPYTPAHWIPAQAARYSVSVTTVAGSRALSTTQGSVISQAAGRVNGDVRVLRPIVLQEVDRWGNVVGITDPRSASWKTTYRYNASNQLVEQIAPDVTGKRSASSPVTSLYYDTQGRQVAVKDANGWVNGQVYDAGGNLVRETHADGGVVTHAYDAFGEKVRTVDAMKNIMDFSYDRMGRLVRLTKEKVPVYTVTAGNTLSSLAVTRNVEETWTYDQLGRKLTQANGNGEVISYAYDLRGNIVATRQSLGETVGSAFDAQGRKIAEVDATGEAVVTWTYDYFGQLQSGHKDLGGAIYSYAYDNARQLVAQTNTRGQSLTYGYDAAGQLTRIVDSATNTTTTYAYDLGGRRIREQVVQGGTTYQDNHLAYDAQGKLRDIADSRAHVTIDYDNAGNRTHITTHVGYQGLTGEVSTPVTHRYFQYDEMNRQRVVDAVDALGNLGRQGHRLAYDANGNRTSDTYWGRKVVTSAGESVFEGFDENGVAIYSGPALSFTSSEGETTEQYYYDKLNRLTAVVKDGRQIDLRRYDAADRVLQSGSPGNLETKYAELLNQGLAPGEMNGKEMRINRYDGNGRLAHQRVYRSDWRTQGSGLKSETSWDGTESIADGATAMSSNGYDAAGNARSYVVKSYEGGGVSEYVNTFVKFEGYQSSAIQGTSSRQLPAATTQQFDANGFLIGISDSGQAANNRTFVNDSEGRALAVNQGGRLQRQLIVNGEVLGIYGVGEDEANTGTTPVFENVADFNFGYAKVTSSYPLPSPGAYTVRTGDTLQTIAQGAYGDSSLWYRIAEANGLASNSDLRVGQTLNVPNRVSAISNNANTFKPYDPSRIEGDKTPTLVTPQKHGGCGGVGKLLMLVVAVVVTIYTVGAATSGTLAFGDAMAAGMEATASVATGGATLGEAGIMAAGAAAGSAASQLVGLATGTIDKFDWKGVALSAIGGGISAGLPKIPLGLGEFGNVIVRAAVTNAVSQGVGVITGLQKRFDWKGVAASAVGAGIGKLVGGELERAWGRSPMTQFAARGVAGLVSGVAAAAMRGGRIVAQQVAVDAFGNALGQSLAGAASNGGTQPTALATGDWARIDRSSDAVMAASQNTPHQSFRLDEIAQQNECGRADAMYGWNTGNDGLGFRPVAGLGAAGMRYEGVRSAMFDDMRVFSDSEDPNALVNVGQGGSPTAQVPPLFNPTAAGGAGVVGGGYQVVRPRGAGGSPGFDIVRELPAGAPGYGQASPSLGLGAPPKLVDGPSWLDFTTPGLPLPVRALGGLLDNLIFKSPSQKLGEALEASGYRRPSDSAAHHIVPEGDARAADIRQRLKDWDIEINSADNGVFLPQKAGSEAAGAYHPKLNNDDYYRQLERDFSGVNTRQRALDTLNDIRGQLLNGTYPGSRPVPPKQ